MSCRERERWIAQFLLPELRSTSFRSCSSTSLVPPHPPPVAPEQETEIAPLGRLVADHPNVFVGLYRDGAGVAHVVFGAGADPAQWADRLREAASGIT